MPPAETDFVIRHLYGGPDGAQFVARIDRLCELNVIHQVRNVTSDLIVRDAWGRGQRLTVHGWVYSLANGLVTDLNISVARPEHAEALA